MHGRANIQTGHVDRILLKSLWPAGSHPQNLLGEFYGAVLMRVIAPDIGEAGLEIRRDPGEPDEAFDVRCANTILAARGLPLLDDIEWRGRRGALPTRGLASVG